MYDQKLADQLTKGHGLGLAPMIMRQLEHGTGQASPRSWRRVAIAVAAQLADGAAR